MITNVHTTTIKRSKYNITCTCSVTLVINICFTKLHSGFIGTIISTRHEFVVSERVVQIGCHPIISFAFICEELSPSIVHLWSTTFRADLIPCGEVSIFPPVDRAGGARLFFFGVRIWLVMTFNYPVLWVRVKGQG